LLLSYRLGSHTFAAPRHCHSCPRPFTRSNRFTPPGTLGGPGRSRATRSPPDRLGPTRSTGGPLGSGQLGSVPRSHPCSAQATRIPAEHTAQADSDPSVQSRHMTLTTTTPPGHIPPARVHIPAGQAQSSRCPRMRTQQATEGVRRGYHHKAYVGARLKLYVQRTLELSCTGRESHTMAPAVWHRPVGGPAGFEPHRHRTATCPHTCGRACPSTYIFEPRPKAQVRLAAAVCLHIAVALELVAGQTWATLQPDQDCGTSCPCGTALRNGPSGQLVVPPQKINP